MNLIIRKAKPEEIEELIVIEHACFPPAEAGSPEQMRLRMQVFPENFIVAELDGKIVGFINGAVSSVDQLPDEMYHDVSLHCPDGSWQTVFGLNVHPDYQKRGIAAKLVEGFIDNAKDAGRQGIILTCKEHMIHYYEKFGFQFGGLSDSTHGGAEWNKMKLTF